ncbi:MAG: carboxypeptidase regulatory-like domain-containing protein, partial [Candidatus Eremiobacteraeota bacterium]|nr:carboxypeptidase regulatory-like domain-containing protein [Candidatus Eremiobacteraeota bacterium]
MALVAMLTGLLLALASGSVTGSVKDGSGHAVAGASVVMTGPRSYTATTDSAGGFSFADVVAGTYGVRVSKGGYQTASESGIVIESGGPTSLTLTLLAASLQTIANVRSTGGGPHFNTTPAA